MEAGAGKTTGSINSGGNYIGTTTITGSLVGNANDNYSGRISAYATIGNLSIGSMTYGRVHTDAVLVGVTVYGDVKGSYIASKDGMGNVTITGSLIGTITGSGQIHAGGSSGAVNIGGSILGGAGWIPVRFLAAT